MIFKFKKHSAIFYLYQTSFRSSFSLNYKDAIKKSPKPKLFIQASLIAYEEQDYCNWRLSAETKLIKTAYFLILDIHTIPSLKIKI